MNVFEITNSNVNNINFAPENELLEILQNVRTILSTPKVFWINQYQ
mgnify:CR=1 FL=1